MSKRRIRISGVALLQVLFAMVVISVGVLGMSAMQLRTVAMASDAGQRSVAVLKAQDLADRMRGNNSAVDTYLGIHDRSLCKTAPTLLCADGSGKSGVACTPVDVANHDLWDVFCGGDGSIDTSLVDWRYSVLCDDVAADCSAADATATIAAAWFTRSDESVGASTDTAATGISSGTYALSFTP